MVAVAVMVAVAAMAGAMVGVLEVVTSTVAATSTVAGILPTLTISEAGGLPGMAAKASVRPGMQRSDPAISARR
jgi:hypothetical protein